MVAQEELIWVCIDNSWTSRIFWSQIKDAIHLYCHAKLKSNPKTAVGAVAMALGGLERFGRFLSPTSDLDEIMYRVQGIARGGDMYFLDGISCAERYFMQRQQPNVQKRILILTGGPKKMGFDSAKVCGNNFKEMGIAVDLVNFCLEEEHKCKRRALNLFVASVNNNENSHIKHVLPGSSIRDVLSSTPPIITREEIAAAGDLKRIIISRKEIPGAGDVKRIPCFPRKTVDMKKVIKTVDMKLFLEEVRKIQAAADDAAAYDEYVKARECCPLELLNKFEPLTLENEEIAAADYEHVRVQRRNNKDHRLLINSDLKKTEKNQKRAKESVNLIQELEPYRDAKNNQAAADSEHVEAQGMKYGKHVPQEILNQLEALTRENEKLKLEIEKLKLENEKLKLDDE